MARMESFLEIGINESGVYSGEVDYSIKPLFNRLKIDDLESTRKSLRDLALRTEEAIERNGGKPKLFYRFFKIANFSYFKRIGRDHQFWPIKIKRGCSSISFIDGHGWQTGWKNGSRVYGWTLYIGKTKICFGKNFK